MGVPSDAAVPAGNVMRQLDDVKGGLAQTRTARRSEATSVGSRGTRWHSGGSATFEDGGGIEVRDGGDIVVDDGGDITLQGGGLLTVQDGSRIVVRYPTGGDAAYFGYIGDGTEIIGYGLIMYGENGENLLRVRQHVDDGRQVIIGGTYPAAAFQVFADATLIRGQSLDVDATADVEIEAAGNAFFTSSAGPAAIGGGTGTFIQPQSGSGTANVRMDTGTGQITWVASTERVKTDIRDLEVDPAAVLALRPRTWLPGPTMRQCPDWMHTKHAEGECHAGELIDPPPDAPREVGFVAEELDALGLDAFVEYDTDGAPAAIRYDRLTAALVPLVQAQQQQITDLAARLDAIEARLAEA